MRLFSHAAFDPDLLELLLHRHAALRDQFLIEETVLATVEIDTSPLGNTDPDVLLRNLRGMMSNFALNRRKARWLRFMMDDNRSVFFDCQVNGNACRTYEQLQWIERKLVQDSRLKKLAIEFSDFFRSIDISVGKDNVMKFLRLAEEYHRNSRKHAKRTPKPAIRPIRAKRSKAPQAKIRVSV